MNLKPSRGERHVDFAANRQEFGCDCGACEGWRNAHPATKPAWTWLSDEWHDMEPERRERIAAALRDVDEIFHTWIAQRAERIMLTNDERAKFVAWLRQDADQEAGLVEFLADLPAGTNGAHIRTDCKIRRDVKRALAEEIERGR